MIKILFITIAVFTLQIAHAEHSKIENSNKKSPGELFPQPKANKSKSTLPSPATIIEPAFMAVVQGGSTVLKWNAVDIAENYHLQVATDPNFKWLVVDDQLVKKPSYELSGLDTGKLYYWRVAAVRNSNDAMYIKGPYSRSTFETK